MASLFSLNPIDASLGKVVVSRLGFYSICEGFCGCASAPRRGGPELCAWRRLCAFIGGGFQVSTVLEYVAQFTRCVGGGGSGACDPRAAPGTQTGEAVKCPEAEPGTQTGEASRGDTRNFHITRNKHPLGIKAPPMTSRLRGCSASMTSKPLPGMLRLLTSSLLTPSCRAFDVH